MVTLFVFFLKKKQLEGVYIMFTELGLLGVSGYDVLLTILFIAFMLYLTLS